MKITIFLSLLFCFSLHSVSQIYAKTSNGRNVILNNDGTWKYSDKDPEDESKKPCALLYTGDITVINNHSSDVYFYYTRYTILPYTNKMVKIKAGATKLIKDIPGDPSIYHWVSLLEIAEGNTKLEDMRGIANGTFIIIKCGNNEVEID